MTVEVKSYDWDDGATVECREMFSNVSATEITEALAEAWSWEGS